MDEPLSNLDAKLRVQTRSQIATLQAKLGVTTVYVTHDQVEAMTMGHRVAVMLDGVLQQVDTPRALYDTPANVFVAGFMGSPAMNIKTVPLTEQGGRFGPLTVPLTREQVAAARARAATARSPSASARRTADLVGPSRGRHADRRRPGRGPRLGRERLRPRRARGRLGALRGPHRPAHMPNMGETVFVKPQRRPHATSSTPPPASASDVRDKKGCGTAAAGTPLRRLCLRISPRRPGGGRPRRGRPRRRRWR